EFQDHWFVRSGGRCRATTTVGWRGNAFIAFYTSLIGAATWLLLGRTLVGFAAAIVLITALFVTVVVAKTRGGVDL
ncbi:MAG: hypothetical protein JO276_01240, partial [Sphingomonadaceae bacterium]|nr:hypothetical protein [Sphingomonadaceae bacterium]